MHSNELNNDIADIELRFNHIFYIVLLFELGLVELGLKLGLRVDLTKSLLMTLSDFLVSFPLEAILQLLSKNAAYAMYIHLATVISVVSSVKIFK